METKMSENVKPQELVEVEEPIELDEEITTTRPPDRITLPQAQTQARPTVNQPLVRLARLGQEISQVKPIEPPPRPAPVPRVHQRPSEGFD